MKPSNSSDSEEEGTSHFMVNIVQPQFNLHSEEANVGICCPAFLSVYILKQHLSVKEYHIVYLIIICFSLQSLA